MSTEVVLDQMDHPVMPRVGSPIDLQVVLDAAIEPPEPTRVYLVPDTKEKFGLIFSFKNGLSLRFYRFPTLRKLTK